MIAVNKGFVQLDCPDVWCSGLQKLSEWFHHRCFAEAVCYLVDQSIPASHITDVPQRRKLLNSLQVAVCGPDGILANYESSILDLFFREVEFSGVEDHPSSTTMSQDVADSDE